MSRQLDKVLIKVAMGKTNAEIAMEMRLRESTVKGYVYRLMKECEVNSRVKLALVVMLGCLPTEKAADEMVRIMRTGALGH